MSIIDHLVCAIGNKLAITISVIDDALLSIKPSIFIRIEVDYLPSFYRLTEKILLVMILYRRWEHQEKQRYYQILISKDLFGDCIVTRVWGGINKAAGRAAHFPCSTYQEAIDLIENIGKTRVARGYMACDIQSQHALNEIFPQF